MPRKSKAAVKAIETTNGGVEENGNGVAEEKLVTKRVSGRVRKQPTPEIVPEPVKKTARGGKKRATQDATVDEEISEPPKKTTKGAKKSTAEIAQNGNSKESSEAKKSVGRGKRGATPAAEEAGEPTKKTQSGRSKKPRIEETIEEADEDKIDEEEETAAEEPAKKPSGRGMKKSENAAAKDTASAKKSSTGGRGRKRAGGAKKENDITEEAEDEEAEPAKNVKTTAKAIKTKTNPTKTPYEKINFNLEKEHNLKISSWNVAGVRAWIGKGGLEFIEHEKPDIICFQELKCNEIPDEARISGYHPYWLCNASGRAGVAIFSKKMPIHVDYGIGDEEQDSEGHLMTAEYEKFFLVNVYVPNSGRKLVTLPKRMRWDALFHDYLTKLNAKKPVIICGDMNVSHQEIDLANPKSNKRNAGFTQEERDGLTHLLSLGYIDTFRHFYPDSTGAYTFWTYMGNARSKNVGWRLDYFIVSEKILQKIVDNVMRSDVLGSDHCPITLFLNV